MHASLLPADVSLSMREHQLVGIGVTLLHMFLAVFLLRGDGHGVLDAGDKSEGLGAALSVTFITLAPPTSSERVPLHTVPLLASTPDNGSDALTKKTNTASAKTFQVLSEVGEQSQTSANVTRETAVANTASAAKVGRGDDRLTSYHAALRAAIRSKWSGLTDRPFPSGCALRMTLATGGTLNATTANGCALSNEDRLQLEAAALMAQPLPYAGYEDVFEQELTLTL